MCATKDEKSLKSTAISVTPTAKANRKVTEGTEIHKETAMKKQKEHDMVLKLQISCNKKEFYIFLTQ